MKKTIAALVVIVFIALGIWYVRQNSPVAVDNDVPAEDALKDFTASTYTYTASPTLQIQGTKYVVPKSLTNGTNLANDTYVSRESIPGLASCSGDRFFDGAHQTITATDPVNKVTYSVATSSGAGAGNRYEEVVYAVPGTDPCIGIRFFIHYSNIQNYEPGAVMEFNKQALGEKLDRARRALYPTKDDK